MAPVVPDHADGRGWRQAGPEPNFELDGRVHDGEYKGSMTTMSTVVCVPAPVRVWRVIGVVIRWV